MAKSIIKTKEFELPVYSARVIFVYSNSYDAISEFAKTEELSDKDVSILKSGGYSGYCFHVEDDTPAKKSNTYIIIKKNSDKYKEIDAITHEVLHAVVNVLTERGLKFNSQNEEAYTYLTGFLNKEFFKFKDGK